MTNKFVAVDADGCIRYTATVSDDDMYQHGQVTPDGCTMLKVPVELDDKYLVMDTWYNGSVLVDKQKMNCTLVNGRLINVPAPCTVTINGQSYQCDEPIVELDFVYPGSYQVKVTAPGFFDSEFEVKV